MRRHFEREMELLKRSLVILGTAVEEAVHKAFLAFRRRDAILAREVIEGDTEIDRLEVNTEEECLKALALHQPVANDLRFVVTALKITDELERIGDLASNIAYRAISIAGRPPVEPDFSFDEMTSRTLWMVKQAINCLINADADLARAVWMADDEVDLLHNRAQEVIKDEIRAQPEHLDSLVDWLVVERFTERTADQAKSIAKDVLYMVEGEIVRHRSAEVRAWFELRQGENGTD